MATDAGKQEPPSLDEFSKRLDAHRGDQSAEEKPYHGGGAAWGRAMRVSSDLLAGIIVGVLLGIVLDRWLGTSPWLLLVGIGIGFGAGLRNMSRTLGQANETPDGD
ncbi:MAG: AtpZ/AtpI family protein [Pseudomonadota bacterium]